MSEYPVSLALVALTTVCSAAAPATERDPIPSVPVMVVAYTIPALSQRMLDRAIEESTDVFGNAGVEVFWTTRRRSVRDSDVLDHPVARQFSKPEPACVGFPGACVIVQISDRFPDSYVPRALGLSRPYGKDPGTVRATIFLERVTRLAARMGMPLSRLLAAVMTHELGHVLTGTDAHGPGLMRDAWTLEDFHSICQAVPQFQHPEVRLMHMHLGALARTAAENGDDTPSSMLIRHP